MKKKKIRWPALDWHSYTPSPVIGVDEVGRGCLAGPVCAAAVILNPDVSARAYKDSKMLSEARREALAQEIQQHHRWGIGFASVEEINQLNIFHASLLAMKRAVQQLGVKRGHILVDGKFPIRNMKSFRQTPIIKGDLRCKAISAASILAKVARDQLMKQLHQEYPVYDFQRHKGYSTPQHKELIKIYRPCAIHRRHFAGVKEHFQEQLKFEIPSP